MNLKFTPRQEAEDFLLRAERFLDEKDWSVDQEMWREDFEGGEVGGEEDGDREERDWLSPDREGQVLTSCFEAGGDEDFTPLQFLQWRLRPGSGKKIGHGEAHTGLRENSPRVSFLMSLGVSREASLLLESADLGFWADGVGEQLLRSCRIGEGRAASSP